MNISTPSPLLVTPTVHMNGTGAQELIDLNVTAMDAVEKAIEAVAKAAPHGRDYYVSTKFTYQDALEEHTSRLLALNIIKDELLGIALAVQEQKR